MKSLHELCLFLIARNITDYSCRLGNYISRRHKEMLLERLCWHDLFTDKLLPTISYHLFSNFLQRINLSHSDQINDETLAILGTSQCQPLSLTIHKCTNVTDRGIEALSKLSFFIKMEYLNLSNLKKLKGEGFQRVGSKSIKHLVLSGCAKMKDTGLIDIIRRCSQVTVLSINEMYTLTNHSITTVAETLGQHLEELSCSENATLTSVSTIALAKHCHSLKRVVFEGCVKLDGHGLVQMAENCMIEFLSISFCYKLLPSTLDTLISTINAKRYLTSLELMAITFGQFTTEFISSCHSLTHLFIAGVTISDKEFTTMCKRLGEVLVELDISGCPSLTDASCKSIAIHLKCLEFLGMRNMREISGIDLCPLFEDPVRAANIRYIAFSGSKNMSPQLIQLIATNCYNMETLLIAGLKGITDDIAFLLAHNCSHLTYCSLRNCQLTDMGVSELAIHCKNLIMIALAGIHELTDHSIVALANNCPYMEEIHLSGCARITKQALAFLSDCVIGSLFINHAVPNAPPGLLMAKDLDTGRYERVDN